VLSSDRRTDGGIKDVAAQQSLAQAWRTRSIRISRSARRNGAAGVSPTSWSPRWWPVPAHLVPTCAARTAQAGPGRSPGRRPVDLDGAAQAEHVLRADHRGPEYYRPGEQHDHEVHHALARPAGRRQDHAADAARSPGQPGQRVVRQADRRPGAVARSTGGHLDPPIQAPRNGAATARWSGSRPGCGSRAAGHRDAGLFGKAGRPGLFGGGDLRSSFRSGDLTSTLPSDNLNADLPPGPPRARRRPRFSDRASPPGARPAGRHTGCTGVGAPVRPGPGRGAAAPPAAPPAARSNGTSPGSARTPPAQTPWCRTPTPDSARVRTTSAPTTAPPTTRRKAPPATQAAGHPQLPVL